MIFFATVPSKYLNSIVFVFALTSCSTDQLDAPRPPAVVQHVADNWSQDQSRRITQKIQYIKTHQTAFDWFANFSFSETDGTPYIILRLLPIIAPELWGREQNFLEVIGLFNDSRQPGYPMPRGIGISALMRNKPLGDIDYTSFTCAACHIGRVRTETGTIQYIDGGVNAEFNIVLYRVKLYQTLQTIIADQPDPSKQQTLILNTFLSALKKAQSISNTFFYRGYKNQWINFNADYEKAQIDLFIKDADQYLIKFTARTRANYSGYAALLNKNYSGFQAQSLQGFPGMADATGIFTINSYNDAQDSFFARLLSNFILPDTPGITDFMSVWEQQKRKAKWDESHKTLINGGGQWNGNIPIPMYRNLAAQLTLGLSNPDIRVSAFGVDLLDKLPATVYPFKVDITLAKQGEKLFSKNCAQCHQPHNGKVYDMLNVNLDRSAVVNRLIRFGGINNFNKVCSPSTSVNMGGQQHKPCAKFDGVSLEGKKDLIISPNDQHRGYNARPLSGIWAQAPYLHNGSIPTAYHLLIPNERPSVFYKSRLEYDQDYLGFAWTAPMTTSDHDANSYIYDTNSFSAFSNVGHDTDIRENGETYKLNWTDDKDGAKALIEYLKTL